MQDFEVEKNTRRPEQKLSKCGYTLQSQETAEIYVQVITTIFTIFKRQSDIPFADEQFASREMFLS